MLEATAPKVGNVHRGADFDDLTFTDFMASAVAIAPAMELAAQAGVGQTIHTAITATRSLVDTNTNLGIVLLLAPLAAVPQGESLGLGVAKVLRSLTPDDSRLVYAAIRLAMPGGLGKVDEMDVGDVAPPDLLVAMRAAADRDLVARQYAQDFQLVLEQVGPWILAGTRQSWSLTDAIIHTHLRLLAEYPDSLILRKRGPKMARQVSTLAASILAIGGPPSEEYYAALSDFDFFLRSDDHQRNPGTTADLIAAGLFALLRDGALQPPLW